MAGFSFNFDLDDIEQDEPDGDNDNHDHVASGVAKSSQDLSPVKLHTLSDMLSTLPSSISYSIHTISTEPPLRLPRRELFDIRAQLLAEVDSEDAISATIAEGLTSDDIQPRLYEGGFKTWECSLDLARFLVNEITSSSENNRTDVVEIGAGTAVPSCAILNALLERYPPGSGFAGDTIRSTIIVADYNEHVLTHASVPNLLLTFALATNSGNGEQADASETDRDLEITQGLIDDFQTWLEKVDLQIFGVSGAWSPRFNELVDGVLKQRSRWVLASETIYQPEYLTTFTAVLSRLLETQGNIASSKQALIAAKKIYFGVGGGVDEFLSVLRAAGGRSSLAWSSGSSGVSRVILRVDSGNQDT